MAKILLVEDDISFSRLLDNFLKRKNHSVDSCTSVSKASELVTSKQYDLLLLDFRLPDGDGLDILSKAREVSPHSQAIIMTGFNDVRTAVKAMRAGAFDYITKPVNPEELLMVMQEALGKEKKKTSKKSAGKIKFIEGESPQAQKLGKHINLVAPTDISVVIQGESGTGKEYIARSIHEKSKRSGSAFVAVDCGAISGQLATSALFGHIKGAFTGATDNKKGHFESAHGGTLFLDEVGNLDYDVQVLLLRALQERVIQPVGSSKTVNVDVRIITATNEDLYKSVETGEFREDLYHRLNEFSIYVAPIRERGADINLFIEHFKDEANNDLNRAVGGFSDEVLKVLYSYDWPGNLRQLRYVIRRLVLLSQHETAGIESLPDEMIKAIDQPRKPSANTRDLKTIQENTEKDMIQKTLVEVRYNKSKAARLLNIDRKTLYQKMEKYDIEG